MRTSFFIIGALLCLHAAPANAQDASGYDVMRIENEDKLVVPLDMAEEVWNYIMQSFVENPDSLSFAGTGGIRVMYAIEDFTDTYFDTPTLDALQEESGIRLRYRVNRTDPDSKKSGRRLMQVKISGIDDNPLNRAEYKYDVVDEVTNENVGIMNPVAVVDSDQREDFAARLAEFGWNGYAMKPVLTLQQERKRAYFSNASGAIMSISHDTVSSELFGYSVGFVELEPELSEVEYTEASSEVRRDMEAFQQAIVARIRQEFPAIERDLAPKYNKTFQAFREQVPWLTWKIRFGVYNFYALIGIVTALVVMVAGFALKQMFFRKS